jgi:hypothetical protein
MTAAHDYSDLHELIDRLEPEQADELRQHALRLVRPTGTRFKGDCCVGREAGGR